MNMWTSSKVHLGRSQHTALFVSTDDSRKGKSGSDGTCSEFFSHSRYERKTFGALQPTDYLAGTQSNRQHSMTTSYIVTARN
jgi:hypothetical protein